MLSKESKIRVLENFYGIDYAIFGKPVSEVEICCPILKEEYMSVKGALLSVYVEMLKLVEHTPDPIEEHVDSTILIKRAKRSAKMVREHVEEIVTSEKSRDSIKRSLKEDLSQDDNIDLSKLIESKVRAKAFSLAVDSLLLVPALNESKAYDKLNEWTGRIIEDSYKVLRDNLVESAIQMLYDDDDMFTVEEKVDNMADLKRDYADDWKAYQSKCARKKTPEERKMCLAKAKAKIKQIQQKMKASKMKKMGEAYETDPGNVASGEAMKNAKGAGTEQAGTSDAKSIPGEKMEKEKDITKEGFDQYLNEAHPEFVSEAFEFLNFLSVVGNKLMADANLCNKTECHKKGFVISKMRSGCKDMCWAKSLRKGISTLNAGKSRCRTARNPEKCVARFDKLIARYQKLIPKYTEAAKRKMKK